MGYIAAQNFFYGEELVRGGAAVPDLTPGALEQSKALGLVQAQTDDETVPDPSGNLEDRLEDDQGTAADNDAMPKKPKSGSKKGAKS